ncbi:beta-1,3-glucanase family protein [Limibacter armeniacum]|uniref:beta-1,3-glucanase family protein n=1 Tax=Limibacter armeniacum TaxID=466084 RepID=UPI002FE5C1F8
MKTKHDLLSITYKSVISIIFVLIGNMVIAQTLPYQLANNSDYADDQIYVAVVGITGGHVWVDPVTGQVHQMSQSDNTVAGPVYGGNMGPGNNGLYANCFRKLSDIPNRTLNLPQIAGCRIFIAFQSQLYLYFFGYSGAPSGYAAPNLQNATDPNQGIKFEIIELTYNNYGLWCNTTRVDSYQYPMGLEIWGGNSFYKKVGELKTHQQILSEWQATAPSEFQGLLDAGTSTIHFPTKSTTFPQSLIQNYIDQIWSKYSSQQLVFNSGDAGTWRGSVSGSNFVFTRDSDGQVATIPGKPTTVMAMEASGVMASGGQWDLVVQAQIAAAINRHAINLNLGSGVLQDFSNSGAYYQTWPYNWYAKFWHRSDISNDGQTYAFSFDDVFDQSATIHTPSPTSIKITIGGFAGLNNNNGVATMYQHCNYGGYAISLNTGSYTLSQLQSMGIADNDISSLRVQSGYKVTMYDNANFTGNSIVKMADDDCLVNEGFNDVLSSVVVSQVSAGFSTQIEAEDYAVMSGIQTEACSEGGLNVGWIETGDWIVWDVNLPASGSYNVEYRVASANSGGVIQLEQAGGSPIFGTVGVPNTGDWQNWTSISHNVNMNAGQQQVAIYVPAGGYNLNWLKITSNSGARVAFEKELDLDAAKINIYPNPSSNKLNIQLPSEESIQAVQLYDMAGKVVKTWLHPTSEKQALDISSIKAGIYILKLKTNVQERAFRVIKE